MIVHVTEKHIALGEARICKNCPIALALKYATGKQWFVGPDWSGEFWTANNGFDSFVLSTECLRFVRDFDNGRPVTPFSFDEPKLDKVVGR